MSEKSDMVREEGNDSTTFTSTRFGAIMRHACSKNNFGLQNDLGPASVPRDTIPDEIYVEIGDVRRPQKYIEGNYERKGGYKGGDTTQSKSISGDENQNKLCCCDETQNKNFSCNEDKNVFIFGDDGQMQCAAKSEAVTRSEAGKKTMLDLIDMSHKIESTLWNVFAEVKDLSRSILNGINKVEKATYTSGVVGGGEEAMHTDNTKSAGGGLEPAGTVGGGGGAGDAVSLNVKTGGLGSAGLDGGGGMDNVLPINTKCGGSLRKSARVSADGNRAVCGGGGQEAVRVGDGNEALGTDDKETGAHGGASEVGGGDAIVPAGKETGAHSGAGGVGGGDTIVPAGKETGAHGGAGEVGGGDAIVPAGKETGAHGGACGVGGGNAIVPAGKESGAHGGRRWRSRRRRCDRAR